MREDVVLAHAELASLCEHIHLPLQSGSSRILKAMRRTYDRERYLDRVALIREHVPGLRADDRHHRRLPGGDRGGLRSDARRRRGGRLRRSLHVHLLAAPRDRGRDADRRHRARTRSSPSAWSGSSRPSSAARASARSASSAARSTCSSRARRARTRPAARPLAPQQGRQLRRPRAARRDRAGATSPRRRARRWRARCRWSRGRSPRAGCRTPTRSARRSRARRAAGSRVPHSPARAR